MSKREREGGRRKKKRRETDSGTGRERDLGLTDGYICLPGRMELSSAEMGQTIGKAGGSGDWGI